MVPVAREVVDVQVVLQEHALRPEQELLGFVEVQDLWAERAEAPILGTFYWCFEGLCMS